jgi:polyphenol oxidase
MMRVSLEGHASHVPRLERQTRGEVAFWTDAVLRRQHGVVVAFSERRGGVGVAPYDSLNLASHVDDDPDNVDSNRSLLLAALDLPDLRERLTMAEQVHGDHVAVVDEGGVGRGAHATGGSPPLAATDALVTVERNAPLALCFADCVPVILVAPGPAVAVVHAGWRGALASLPGETVGAVCREVSCDAAAVSAYIGAHIGSCHYAVGDEILSQFVNDFGTFARAESGGLNLDAVVTASLESAGVPSCNIARLGTCTAEATDRFFSYRAEGPRTGRHCALACIV